jgi:RNA polymerase sigma-70 factor (ECF subfamily)
MSVDPALREQLIAAVPKLRAFAISLCRDVDRADDLVQETLVKAWSSFDQFEPGTSLDGWLWTILRNKFYTEHRKRRREVEDVEGCYSGRLAAAPTQEARLDFADFRKALAQLRIEQREALLLVTAEGFSYEEAARICACNIGTIKSRVNRARTRLAELLAIEPICELGPDRLTRAAIQAAA